MLVCLLSLASIKRLEAEHLFEETWRVNRGMKLRKPGRRASYPARDAEKSLAGLCWLDMMQSEVLFTRREAQ
jgi:hypothetical protein